MKKIVVFTLLTTCILLSLVGCTSAVKIENYDNLLNELKASKLKVETSGVITQAFFSVEGKIIKVSNEDIQVFEYPDKSKADADIKLIAPKGNPIGANWNLVHLSDYGLGYSVGKVINDPELCDFICFQSYCYLIVLMGMMAACFPKLHDTGGGQRQ